MLRSFFIGTSGPGLDKIETFRAHSLNIFKLSMKVRKLRQGNLRQKVRNIRKQENKSNLVCFWY